MQEDGFAQSTLTMENMTTMLARIQAAGRTDIGRKRDKNQDHYLIADLSKSMQVTSSSLNLEPGSRLYGVPQGRLFVVADGMGGIKGETGPVHLRSIF